MKVLLYGGTFDPPHAGHINLLQSAVREIKPDKVIVMPAGIPPHKAASATPAGLRLAMCRCFCDVCAQVQLSDWEIARAGKSYTVDTIRMLAARYPGAQLFLCIGSDMVETFRQWRQWQQLLGLCTLVVHSRRPHASDFAAAIQSLRRDGATIAVLQAPVLPCSSTALRAGLAAGASPQTLLPETAACVVQRYGLYQPAPAADGGTLQQIEQRAKRTLSAGRYQHTLNVRDMAVQLAVRWAEDPARAALAALLHDLAKEMPKQDMLQILCNNAIMTDNAHLRPVPVWHGACAAVLARTQWGIRDEQVLQAVACHTTGRPGMTKLDKILFLADMTSKDRSYPEADILRRLQMEDLDRAMIEALHMNIQWLEESGRPVDPLSRTAWTDLRKTYNGGNSSDET